MLDKLYLIVVEAAIELVPREIWWHPSVKKYAVQRRKQPGAILLDRSYHHAAMSKLKDCAKRGRPDIAYHILLDAVGSPLYKDGRLRLFVETYDGYIMEIGSGVRLPRAYHRFVGLIEDLYLREEIVSRDGRLLLRLKKQPLKRLVEELAPDTIILLREMGAEKSSYEALARKLVTYKNPLVGIGGFPHGDFRSSTLALFKDQVSIASEVMDASLVACRLIYEVEKSTAMPGRFGA